MDNTVTNHSLRAYGVTKMFQCQVPEKLIMERSGHQSLQGLRRYERTTDSQEMQVCQILDSTKREYGTPSMVQEVSHRRPLSQQTPSAPAFSGCSFTNCTFQIALPPQLQTSTADFSDVNIADSFTTFNSLSIHYTVLFAVDLLFLHCTPCCCFVLYSLLFLYSCSVFEMREAFQPGPAKEQTHVLIDTKGACLCCQVIIRC